MPTVDSNKTKIAKRVLEIFEYFSDERQEAKVSTLARYYGYPQSSTSELLNSLAKLGFLHHDAASRTYRLGIRVAALGGGVRSGLVRGGAMFPMLDELAEDLQCAVAIAGMVGCDSQIFHRVLPFGMRDDGDIKGISRPAIDSAVGMLLLTNYGRDHAKRVIRRLNAEAEPERQMRGDRADQCFADIGEKGFASGPSGISRYPRTCAIMMPQMPGEDPVALAVLLRKADSRDDIHFVKAMRAAVARHRAGLERDESSRDRTTVAPLPQFASWDTVPTEFCE